LHCTSLWVCSRDIGGDRRPISPSGSCSGAVKQAACKPVRHFPRSDTTCEGPILSSIVEGTGDFPPSSGDEQPVPHGCMACRHGQDRGGEDCGYPRRQNYTHTRTGLFRICRRPISAITRRRAQAASAYPAVAKSRLRPFAEVEPFPSIAPSNFTFDGVRMYLTSSFGEIRCCAAAVSQI
jgi:hypothetical protein